MAIYDVDAIREQEVTIDEDSILDGMLEACDAMMDVLNESKARRKTLDAYRNKEKQYAENAKTYKELQKAAERVGNDNLERKYDNKRINNKQASEEYASVAQNIDHNCVGDKCAERNFKDMMNNYNGLVARKKNVKPTHDKPGYYKDLYEKKKAIKETCLTILSIIDDI